MERTYNTTEVCVELGVSYHTLTTWYRWQTRLKKEGKIDTNYLPEPIKQTELRGKPRMWTQEMVDALKEYKKNMVVGRNGVYGAYSNPEHHKAKLLKQETKK